MRNSIEFKVWGRNAIFTDPISKVGGEFMTYFVPTYESLKGIVDAIYWKPTIVWVIDKVRVMKQIQTESKSIKFPKLDSKKGESDLHIYTYLYDVEYQVSAHFEFNEARTDLEEDRNENKHHNIAKRYLSKGGKRDLFLGKRECVAFVEPCEFGTDEGAYDNVSEINLGFMFHSFNYPTSTKNKLSVNLDNIVMENGVIKFNKPSDCKQFNQVIKNMEYEYKCSNFDESDLEIIKEVENGILE